MHSTQKGPGRGLNQENCVASVLTTAPPCCATKNNWYLKWWLGETQVWTVCLMRQSQAGHDQILCSIIVCSGCKVCRGAIMRAHQLAPANVRRRRGVSTAAAVCEIYRIWGYSIPLNTCASIFLLDFHSKEIRHHPTSQPICSDAVLRIISACRETCKPFIGLSWVFRPQSSLNIAVGKCLDFG